MVRPSRDGAACGRRDSEFCQYSVRQLPIGQSEATSDCLETRIEGRPDGGREAPRRRGARGLPSRGLVVRGGSGGGLSSGADRAGGLSSGADRAGRGSRHEGQAGDTIVTSPRRTSLTAPGPAPGRDGRRHPRKRTVEIPGKLVAVCTSWAVHHRCARPSYGGLPAAGVHFRGPDSAGWSLRPGLGAGRPPGGTPSASPASGCSRPSWSTRSDPWWSARSRPRPVCSRGFSRRLRPDLRCRLRGDLVPRQRDHE